MHGPCTAVAEMEGVLASEVTDDTVAKIEEVLASEDMVDAVAEMENVVASEVKAGAVAVAEIEGVLASEDTVTEAEIEGVVASEVAADVVAEIEGVLATEVTELLNAVETADFVEELETVDIYYYQFVNSWSSDVYIPFGGLTETGLGEAEGEAEADTGAETEAVCFASEVVSLLNVEETAKFVEKLGAADY
jgi:hypothetical protein